MMQFVIGLVIVTDLYYSLLEKPLTFHDVIILMKSVVNKNENNYYYNIRLEKGSYEDRSNRQYC